MNYLKAALLAQILLLPLTVFAHGEEVLLPLFSQIVSILIFIIMLFSIRSKVADKLVLATVYLLTLGLIMYFTADIPYRRNSKIIDLLWIVGPAAITIVVFMAKRLRAKYNSDKES